MKKISSQIIFLFVAIIILIVTLVVFPAIKSGKYDNDDTENKTNYEEVNEELVEIGLVEIEGEPIDISEIPVSVLNNLDIDDYEPIFYTINNIKRRVVHNNHSVSNLIFLLHKINLVI